MLLFPNQRKKDTQRVNVDIPHWMLDALDEEAARKNLKSNKAKLYDDIEDLIADLHKGE